MKKWTLVSLGMSCQSAHQLARFADENPRLVNFQKSPFDWLICPIESAAKWLDSDLEIFSADEIIVERDHAYWPKYDFWFWHGFYSKSGEEKILDIKTNVKREQEKLEYQRSTFEKLDPNSTLFFISNVQNNLETEVFVSKDEFSLIQFSDSKVEKLQNSLNNFFKTTVQLNVISTPKRIIHYRGINSDNFEIKRDYSEWKGKNNAWNLILNRLISK